MPAFNRAEVSEAGVEDLTPYLNLLEKHGAGTRLLLPLVAGDRPRVVARSLNRAASQQGKRLRRVRSNDSLIEVVVLTGERRVVNLTPEQRAARVAKARATRQANASKYTKELAEALDSK